MKVENMSEAELDARLKALLRKYEEKKVDTARESQACRVASKRCSGASRELNLSR
jgi:hypothetical protein